MTNKKSTYIYLVITLSLWGSLYVVSKFILDKVPTFTVLFLRYAIAIIALFLILRNRKVSPIERKDYPYILFIGIVGYFISIAAQFLGTKFSNAATASLINSTNPIFIIIFSVLILKEKFTFKKAICVVLAITGTVIILGGDADYSELIGILFSLCSVISWSAMSVIVRKVTQKYDSIQVTTYAIIIAFICTIPCCAYEIITSHNSIKFDGQVILSILYIGIACTAVSHVLWNKSLSLIEASSCSLFYPIQPMVSTLLGCMFLNEIIHMKFILGAALIIAGIIYSVIPDKTEALNAEPVSKS